MKPTRVQFAVFLLVGLFALTLLCSVIANAWGYLQVYGVDGWRDQVYRLEGLVASQRALRDFREGHLRLYQLGGESEAAKFTGTNDGPFEVWVPQFYPSLGRAHRYSTEQFIDFYNRKMHYMFSHPEKFRATNGTVQLQHGADPDQPLRSP
jgi:hypothetical protein